MRLGFITEASSNGYYRAVIPMRALDRRGHTVVWQEPLGKDLSLRQLLTCDLVHCFRRTDQYATLSKLAERGVAISFDNDDDFSSAEVNYDGKRLSLGSHKHYRNRFKEISRSATLADVTTTTTETLAAQYRSAGAENVAVIENHLEQTMFAFGSRAAHDGIVIGWVAGSEHSLDMKRIPIVDTLKLLLEQHPDVHILTVGLRLPLHSDRYEYIREVKYRDLLKPISRMDIAIAPLADTQFNRARSNVKLKEYASAGAAWLASPVGPYVGLGEKQGGQLVGDDDWHPALDALIRNGRIRKRLSKHALKWAKQQTIDRNAKAWEQTFEDARHRASARTRRATM
jgi:glycosyltransferase involved in cell wall biosynthesis